MKEIQRTVQDQTWIEQKVINREVNLALLEGIYHGKFFRRQVMARKVMQHFISPEPLPQISLQP